MKADLLDAAAETEEQALVAAPTVSMFERLAMDPNVPVDKLERLIAAQERINAFNAKAAFDAAFSEMQGEIPIITERGEIVVNGTVRSKYAKLEDILLEVRPILQRHGFALRFRNEITDDRIKVTGILSHRGGHSEQDEFVARPDNSGAKADIQQIGSTRSYGQRYTTIALLNIATKGEDNDGQASQVRADVKAPAGFEAWWTILEKVADSGWPTLSKAWGDSKPEFRNHVMAVNKGGWLNLKKRAEAIK